MSIMSEALATMIENGDRVVTSTQHICGPSCNYVNGVRPMKQIMSDRRHMAYVVIKSIINLEQEHWLEGLSTPSGCCIASPAAGV